jgi:hypothetical protein
MTGCPRCTTLQRENDVLRERIRAYEHRDTLPSPRFDEPAVEIDFRLDDCLPKLETK